MFDLSGKTALITGATGGIGGEIAKALHAQGAVVAISGRNKEKLDALAAELGSNTHAIIADLSNSEGIAQLIKDAEDAMGQIDILVNNAGLTRDNLSMRMKDEEWDEVIDVNLTAPFKLAKACQRGMMKRRNGRIINISSVVGTTGNPGQCNYVASKAGLMGWTKAMGMEVASRGITVNCVAPGFIATAMTEALTDDQKAKINATIPMSRMGAPHEIASAVVYLASDEAAYMTGATLHVNGGMAMV
ncbi:MAG: 3-oxoacyl-[acyl-carrier-protein] reductase [Alphaproteobacteria bacterium]|nr:3-oxoacyl-[acyl-carrier-protein] reductase [Alphaproteobacteria bacterium]NCQ88975.1 3-oxoacyl-[acyl-carrier-protein] reductase [Alphaproteobacteria bacterium]NCT07876.1 3-oxoacyl-[acyl-carrier-protein] reductase [Alphaproteobacteria bacterium]